MAKLQGKAKKKKDKQKKTKWLNRKHVGQEARSVA